MIRWREKKTNKPVPRSAWARSHPPNMTAYDNLIWEEHMDILVKIRRDYILFNNSWLVKDDFIKKLENSNDSLD